MTTTNDVEKRIAQVVQRMSCRELEQLAECYLKYGKASEHRFWCLVWVGAARTNCQKLVQYVNVHLQTRFSKHELTELFRYVRERSRGVFYSTKRKGCYDYIPKVSEKLSSRLRYRLKDDDDFGEILVTHTLLTKSLIDI